ncbi:GNAT family N-acetyltransferase [Undibacterium sp. SXout20W]|uniref:GNAT family N-acetyltransferase n=1 Tax=Undibacterium sp. SXout20W TaxID=3413051 RepID=UPI003BF051DB
MNEINLSSRVVKPSAMTQTEIALWEQLSSKHAELASPFLSFHYVYAVEKTGANVRVCILENQNQICGFFPFQFKNWMWKILKSAIPVGGQMTDYFGLIAPTSLRITPLQLLTLARLNHINFSHLDEHQLTYGLTGEQPRIGLRIPCREISPSDRSVGIFNKKQSSEVHRREKLLIEEIGPIRFTFNQLINRPSNLRQLIEQKRRQYARTGVPDALADSWKIKLLEQLLCTESPACTGLLSELYAGDQWIASHFGIMGNGILQYWFPVYNPSMAKYSPGRLLLKYIYSMAIQHQVHTIDRGEGTSHGKNEIRSEEHLFYRGAWYNNAPSAFIVRSFQSLVWRLNTKKL